MPATASLLDPAHTRILAAGEVHFEGQFVYGSNHTFLTRVLHPAGERLAVYKPLRGERPLWDFPDGTLAAREVAAWEASQALGWGLVPPTVFRQDGPAGPGSLQLFLDLDPERHYFTFSEQEKEGLRPAAAFDILINGRRFAEGEIVVVTDLMAVRITRLIDRTYAEDEEET